VRLLLKLLLGILYMITFMWLWSVGGGLVSAVNNIAVLAGFGIYVILLVSLYGIGILIYRKYFQKKEK